MAKKIQYFWSTWPAASQQRLFKLVLVGLSVLFFFVFVGTYLFTGTLKQQIGASKEQYVRVIPIVQDIKALRAQQSDLANLPVDEAIWIIIDDLLIEENLVSIRTTRFNEDETGIQVTLNKLSLTKLTGLLHDLRDRASLQTPDCALTRNPDDPRLADVHLVLAR